METLGIPLICVDTPSKWEKLSQTLLQSPVLAWDTETTGLDVLKDTIVGMSFCDGQLSWYIPINHQWSTTWQVPCSILKPFLVQLFGDTTKTWIAHNFKFDYQVIKVNFGIQVSKGTWYDTMIEAWTVDENDLTGLKHCSEKYLKYDQMTFEELLALAGLTKKRHTIRDMPEEFKNDVVKYGCDDAITAWLLHKLLYPVMEKEKTTEAYNKVDIPIIEVLAEAELEGFPIDKDQINYVSNIIETEMPVLLQTMFTITGKEFNPNSSQQVCEILYDIMKFPLPKKRDKKTKKMVQVRSADKESISSLPSNPFCDAFVRYKQLSTLKSSFTGKLIDMLGADGKLHASFNQIGTVTGRFSCSNPKLNWAFIS